MAEVRTLIDGKELAYEGLMDVRKLLFHIDNWLKEKHYDKVENKNYEEVYEDGKQIVIELRPYKKLSDYVKSEMRIFMVFSRLRDAEVEVGGAAREVQRGRAQLSFDSYLVTDYEHKFERTPFFYFFRTVADKFFERGYIERCKDQCMGDCNALQEEIKGDLNMMGAAGK